MAGTPTDLNTVNGREELMRWGLVQKPPAAYHWQAFFENEGLTKEQINRL